MMRNCYLALQLSVSAFPQQIHFAADHCSTGTLYRNIENIASHSLLAKICTV